MVYKEPVQPVMIPKTIIATVKSLIPRLRGRKEYVVYGNLSMTAVIRIAIVKGIEQIEKELSEPK
ncbi:MAG: hypothetical protein WCS88_03810 [Patescibacteria group bacterium]|jgi:hypothetical protein